MSEDQSSLELLKEFYPSMASLIQTAGNYAVEDIMSHYRRRPPSEYPDELPNDSTKSPPIIIKILKNEPTIGYFNHCDDNDDWTPWNTNSYMYFDDDIDWWAYAYLPPEQEKDTK